jgi:hypothetical protein
MKKQAPKAAPAKPETKEQIIERLLSKASLDYRCCGHGKCS